MTLMRSAALLLCLVASVPALAHDLSVDLTAGGARATEQNPRAGYASLGLSGSFDLSDTLALAVDASLTRDRPTAGSPEPPANLLLLGGSVNWLLGDHWALFGAVSLSPRASQTSKSTLVLQGPLGRTSELDATLRAVNSSGSLTLGGSYATLGESAFESTLDASVTATRYSTTQQLESVASPHPGEPTLQEFCTSYPLATRCQLLRPFRAALGELRLSAAYTATLFQDSEVSLEGSWHLYDSDPTQVGYFSPLALVRTAIVGDGIDVAPLLFTLRPQVSHRFGPLTVRLWFRHGHYVSDLGVADTLGLKLQYNFNRQLRATLSASGQRNVDQAAGDPPAYSVTAGMSYRF